MDKDESLRVIAEIRRVLMDVWDPIGVKDQPTAQDEYDGYLAGVCQLLRNGVSDEQLQEHLWRIVAERMELPARKEEMSDTVKALRQIPLSQDHK